MRAFVGGEDVGTGLACHGLDVDEVAVEVIDYQHVGVAGDGWLNESGGQVGEDFSGVGGEVGVNEMEFVVDGFGVGVVAGGRGVIGLVGEGGEAVGAW